MSAKEDLIAAALTAAGAVRWQYPELSDELRELCARAMVQPAAPDMGEVERLADVYADHVFSDGLLGRKVPSEHAATARTALLDYVRGIVIALKIKTEEHDCCAEDLIALRSEAAQRPAGGVAIAQVIESGDYEAKVQWLLNPLPVGSVLYEEVPQPVGEVPACKGMSCGATDGISHSAECQAEHAASVAGGVFVKQPVGTLEGLASDLIARQQPLGDEVTRVLSENMSALYEGAQPVSAAEVPMPEPDRMRTGTDGELYGDWTEYQMIHYGDAREAAGYARGIAAGVAVLVALKPQSGVNPDGTAWLLPISRQDCVEAVAALRGEVKP